MPSYDSSKSNRVAEEDKTWPNIFDHLLKDKERILRPTMVIGGKKVKLDKAEEIFFLGNMRCILTPKGWKFEVPGSVAPVEQMNGVQQ
jgi:hypothetical protein